MAVLLALAFILGPACSALSAVPQEIKVTRIEVLGSDRISAMAIANTSGLKLGQTYAYEEIREALGNIYEMGFFDDVQLYVEEVTDGFELTIEVLERPVIGAIRITGNRKIGKGDIREKVTLAVGSSLDLRLVKESTAAVKDLYAEKGFYIAKVGHETEEVNETTVNLIFVIDEGLKVKVGDIRVLGNSAVSEDAIRDALETKEKGWFTRKEYNPKVFEDVQIGSRPANEEGDIDLVFKIKERQIGVANVGAGDSEEFGLTGFVEFSHHNVGMYRNFPYLGLGKAQNINLRWEFGKLSQIDLSFRDPWFRDTPTLVGGDVFNTRREYDTYTEKRNGFGVVFGKRIPFIDFSRIYLRYGLESRELIPDPIKASDAVKSQAGRISTSSFVATFIRNSVDNPFFPRMGSRTRLVAEWAGGMLGGTTAYQKYVAENSNFLPVSLLGSTVLVRLKVGLVDQWWNSGYIPVYERFRLGGTTAEGVRGYTEREIVPEGNALDEGGRFMLIGSVEYRVPVVRNRAFVLAFVDAGETWNSFRSGRPGFLRRSIGAGFRVEIPMMGQLGLDIAYGFDRRYPYGTPGWKTHFQFGTAGY